MTERRKLVAGNWKMNGLRASLPEVAAMVDGARGVPAVELAICPPATLIAPVAQALQGASIALGGQDCHEKASGAFTGDISAEMLADLGARYVIVGHSERRTLHGETDAVVAAKAAAAVRAGLFPIICLGESLAERDAGETLAVISRQLAGSIPAEAGIPSTVIAYEPVWAIGTGKVATPEQAQAVHRFIRQRVSRGDATPTILYGGSVKPDNAAGLFAQPDVAGGLIGGASLVADQFLSICDAALPR